MFNPFSWTGPDLKVPRLTKHVRDFETESDIGDRTMEEAGVRILCQKLVVAKNVRELRWLIGSPFFPPLTLVSTLGCIHHALPSSVCPDFERESDDIQKLLPKGFEVTGALITGSSDLEKNAGEAIDAARRLRELLSGGRKTYHEVLMGAVAEAETGDIHFFVSAESEQPATLKPVTSVVYEESPQRYVWETGCLLRCELPIELPFYFRANKPSDAQRMFSQAIDEVMAKFKEPQTTFMFEALGRTSAELPEPVIVRGRNLNLGNSILTAKPLGKDVQNSDAEVSSCSQFCLKSKSSPGVLSAENADKIKVSVLLNSSDRSRISTAPVAEYYPAPEEARLSVVNFRLDVLCYARKNVVLSSAISELVIPALFDQLNSMKKAILPNFLTEHPQLHPYHFSLPGILHPVTILYELNYGETELKQVEARKSLHLRLGLPLDRPLLRIVNALDLSSKNDPESNLVRKGSALLKDVHIGIPSSGVSEGTASLIQGSYEYYHYLHDGFDDSGWGCAYRSMQTIISWFRLQHYTSIDVPSHREIQQALVEIGDKDPSFVGSREWIGAIELSFVLDKLLGVSCKIINVRSGSELPEKCRELAMHFEDQGTPVMIGGGVLAYTLLGVHYSEASGDCAFLILDPHYTGSNDVKKIVNGGWCGWKKAVDGKGKRFFLQDKFYNLLLPQRPNMV